MRATLLLVCAAVTQADEFSDIFYPAADVGKPKCGLECTADNLRHALQRANRKSQDCSYSECGDLDCDDYSLANLCEASVWHRAAPWYYIVDNAEAVLCCHQIGADDIGAPPDARDQIGNGGGRGGGLDNNRLSSIGNPDAPFGYGKSGPAPNRARSLSPLSFDVPGFGKVSRKSASDMETLKAFAQKHVAEFGLPKPWKKARDTEEPQARRLQEDFGADEGSAPFCDKRDNSDSDGRFSASSASKKDDEADDSDGRRKLSSDSESYELSDDSHSGSDDDCRAAAAYDCNDYFGVRRDLLHIIDNSPWQTPDWLRIALKDTFGRGDIKGPTPSNLMSLCEEGDCRGMDVYPFGAELGVLDDATIDRIRSNGPYVDGDDLKDLPNSFGPSFPEGEGSDFSGPPYFIDENRTQAIRTVWPTKNDQFNPDTGRKYKGSLCFEGLFWSRKAPAVDEDFQLLDLTLASWKVAMAAKTGVLSCCANNHAQVYDRDFVGEVTDVYLYAQRRRGTGLRGPPDDAPPNNAGKVL